MSSNREIIAMNVAQMIEDGDFVNLGIGIPTLVGNYLPKDKHVIFHSENGAAGLDHELPSKGLYDGPETLLEWRRSKRGIIPTPLRGHKDLINAGGNHVSLIPGSSCFDSLISFGIARGGHLDMTVLGAMQVDAYGNLANWMIPGRRENGMGGAMDLVSGAKKVVVAMEHCDKNGLPKILNHCTLPLTGLRCVQWIVTERCILKVTPTGLSVHAIAPGLSYEELQACTEAQLHFPVDLACMLN